MTEVTHDKGTPVLVTQDVINIWGLAVRTSNGAEQDTGTQKIAPLWQQFMRRSEVTSNTTSPIYGCYFDYESDHNGEFSVLAGLSLQGEASDELVKCQLQAGEYLRFTASGEMPAVIISLWGEIWQYFNDTNCQFERRYDTDYECYTSMDGVDIYIGVNPKSFG